MVVSCLSIFSFCPNRRAGLWLGLEGMNDFAELSFSRAQETETHTGLSPWRTWWLTEQNPPENLALTAPWSHCTLTVELTVYFSSPGVRSHLLPAWRRQGADGRSLRAPAANMSSENFGHCSGSQLPLLWKVPTGDPELRVVFPGWVKLQRNQEP